MINSFINNYFGFNKQQRSGLLVLMFISLFLLIVRIVYPYFLPPGPVQVKNLPLVFDSSFARPSPAEGKMNGSGELFRFDPNAVTYDELLRLGLNKKTAGTFIKLRNKGFVFKIKTDLKKVYGINEILYSNLEPYIYFTETKENFNYKKLPLQTKPARQSQRVELNTADSLTLLAVNGIGPSYAKRILKYRSLLGGYISVEQLKEVYGLSPETYEKIKDQFSVDAALIKKIDPNRDDFKKVNAHPYITYELTKTIFDWRRKTTINSRNFQEIIKNDTLYWKLKPYLILD